ncbi:cobyric acid synthase CobQ [Methanocella sp. CWC-04]|uniref:Probable cobyric acid synthase n=1 Tax=Methanooceanicella nereidis TaxID=2052831 RepID=A0AAP2W5N5_9EURY|nr:cobyric acid synthase [Methanocella sp. CWC-04]MCD1295710.1 cobyric acid synthase CobQ [Methanocella sp. CWC-04]
MSQNNGTRYITILGTQSHAGKSVLVTALCRILKRRGYNVAPFKAQNMSLNSWITKDGKEIGIAQAIQAFAAGVEPSAEMNPVLLKPKGDMTSQVIVMGEAIGDKRVGQYYSSIDDMMAVAKGAIEDLSQKYDMIVIEGAGGAAEINLYDRDIANSRMAHAVGSPIILVGDIERGGVFASIYGTIALMPEGHKKLVKGIIINKFRGEVSLLKSGIEELEKLTGVPVLGVIPYRELEIPSEDSVSISDKKASGSLDLDIAIIRFPFISNFTDFEPLERIARVRYVSMNDKLGSPDIVILPGSKNTVSDLRSLGMSRLWDEIKAISGSGTPILGICGGYQIMGQRVVDNGIEGDKEESIEGLGLLPSSTVFDRYEKQTRQTVKMVTAGGPILGAINGSNVRGYEIHMGMSTTPSPAFDDDGCVDDTGTMIGTYLHGIFDNKNFRDALLCYACRRKGIPYECATNATDPYDVLADHVESSVDMDRVLEIINEE